MKECKKCSGNIPANIVIEGKRRNLKTRKFCLTCSPFGQHNIRSIIQNNLTCLQCNKDLLGNQTKYCSIKCKLKNPDFKNNDYAKQVQRSRDRKAFFVSQKGGSCQKCGYKKNYSTLCFHHKDRQTKLFNVDARKLSNSTMESLQKEVDKCDLLCLNCHGELHYPETTM